MALVSIPTRAAGIMIILVMVDATGAARSGTLPIAIGRSLHLQRQAKCDQHQAGGNKTAKSLEVSHGKNSPVMRLRLKPATDTVKNS
jgi:hypothetical protein